MSTVAAHSCCTQLLHLIPRAPHTPNMHLNSECMVGVSSGLVAAFHGVHHATTTRKWRGNITETKTLMWGTSNRPLHAENASWT